MKITISHLLIITFLQACIAPSLAQDPVSDSGECLPCLIGIEREHPVVSEFIDRYELVFVDSGYGDQFGKNKNFHLNHIYFDGNVVLSAGIDIKNSNSNKVGDFELGYSYSQLKALHPEIFKKKYKKVFVENVYVDDELQLTSLTFDTEIFGKIRTLSILITNFEAKKDSDKLIYAVSVAGNEPYYYVNTCREFLKKF